MVYPVKPPPPCSRVIPWQRFFQSKQYGVCVGSSDLNEGCPEEQVLHPRAQRLQRGVRGIGPVSRDLIIQEAGVNAVHFLRHHHQALDGLLQSDE